MSMMQTAMNVTKYGLTAIEERKYNVIEVMQQT